MNNKDSKPTILIHSNNQNIVYLENPFYLKDGHGATSVLQCENLNKLNQSFIIGCIDKVIKYKYSYNKKATKIELKNTLIQLPIKNDKIDFEFMEEYIRELEKQKLNKVKEYINCILDDNINLIGGGKSLLNNKLHDNLLQKCQLSNEEKQALADFNNDKIKWGEFKMGDLFERIKTKKLPFKADELPKEPTGKYILPCLTSSFRNQGLNYFAPKENATILKHVISIPSNSDVYRAYFQSNEFTVLSDAYAMRWIFDDVELLREQYLFTVPCINKVTDLSIYSYKNKLGGWNIVQNKYIQLPTKEDKPNYQLMQNLISAIQKQIIQGVIEYTEKKLSTANSNL